MKRGGSCIFDNEHLFEVVAKAPSYDLWGVSTAPDPCTATMQPTKAPWANDDGDDGDDEADAAEAEGTSKATLLPTRAEWANKAASKLFKLAVPPWANKEFPRTANTASTAARKLPMEPTKAPWADGGRGRVFSAPEPGTPQGSCRQSSQTFSAKHAILER